MPFLNRFFGTPILTWLIKHIYNIPTTDCNSGMRLVKKSFYTQLHMTNKGMEWASELLVKTAIIRGKFAEVPITFRRDKRNRPPHLKRWEDGWRHLKVIVLLKPSILLLVALLFILLGYGASINSIFTSITFFLYAESVFFAYIITKRIGAATQDSSNGITRLIDRAPRIIIGIVLNITVIISLFIISDDYLHLKYILLFQVVLFNVWLYFDETIKTYIVDSIYSHKPQ
jgi:hypothetical protein